VQVFDRNGNYLTQFGNTGNSIMRFQDPIGIAINSLGDVYVADGVDSDIHVYSPFK
jgi:DNA-binding beta-propeller fold protein YncE